MTTLTALLMSASNMQAQQLQVQSFKLDATDVTASTERRMDGNGSPCALIKLQTTAKIARIEGNVVGNIIDRGNEKWVYVTKGTDHLTITPEGESPINITFSNYNVSSAKGLLTYVLVFDSQVSSGEAKFKEADLYLEQQQFEKAFESMKQAMNEGYVPAINAVGLFYQNGWGVEASPAKALEYFQKGAELGEQWALLNLANQYMTGHLLPKNPEKAFSLYEKSANQGNAIAQFSLANLYTEGAGVKKDFTKATEWLEKAAGQGHVEAQRVLGSYYFVGAGVPVDREKGIYWLRKAAEQNDIQAIAMLGNVLLMDGKQDQAMEYFKRGAILGEPNSMVFVATAYLTGEYGMAIDFNKAYEYFKKAEDGGVQGPGLYAGLSQCYENGWGTPKNKELARKYKELSEEALKQTQQKMRDVRKQIR